MRVLWYNNIIRHKGVIMDLSEIQNYHSGLLARGILHKSPNTVWAQHNGNNTNPYYPWKMHLFADGYTDWYNLSRIVIPYLVQQNATFKTINPDDYSVDVILQDRAGDQFGKAFTIYPNSEAEFKRLAIGLNSILNQANLRAVSAPSTNRHNIGFERTLGDTGRIFYRAERDARGQYVDARDAVRLNPRNPYNPYNFADPLSNLFGPQKTKGASDTGVMAQIKQIASVQRIKNSADNNEGSTYFYPKNDADGARLVELFRTSGIKYDIHFSRLMGRKVIRVLDRDMPQQNTNENQQNVMRMAQNKNADRF